MGTAKRTASRTNLLLRSVCERDIPDLAQLYNSIAAGAPLCPKVSEGHLRRDIFAGGMSTHGISFPVDPELCLICYDRLEPVGFIQAGIPSRFTDDPSERNNDSTPVVRMLIFPPDSPKVGALLLYTVLERLAARELPPPLAFCDATGYPFAQARNGSLWDGHDHVSALLSEAGFAPNRTELHLCLDVKNSPAAAPGGVHVAHNRFELWGGPAEEFKAYRDGGKIGHVMYLPLSALSGPELDGDWYLQWLWVDPSWRRRGLGRALLGLATSRVADAGGRTLHLHVEQENASAASLYTRVGWRRASLLHSWGFAEVVPQEDDPSNPQADV